MRHLPPLLIGVQGVRLLENASIFFVRCIAAAAFLVLREIAVDLRPRRQAEEAHAPPRGKRTPGTESSGSPTYTSFLKLNSL